MRKLKDEFINTISDVLEIGVDGSESLANLLLKDVKNFTDITSNVLRVEIDLVSNKINSDNLVKNGFKEQKANNLYLFSINQDSSVFVSFDHEGLIMDSGISTYVDDADTLFCKDVDIYVPFKTMKDIKNLIYSLTGKEL